MTEGAFEPGPYQSLVEHLPVVVYVSNDEQPIPRTLYISPNVEQLTGYQPSAFLSLGEAWTSILHPDDVETIGERYATSWASGEAFELEYRFIHPDGRVIWVRDRAVPFVDPESGDRIWQGVLEDVSDRIAAEERGDVSELRYETLLQNLPAVFLDQLDDQISFQRFSNFNNITPQMILDALSALIEQLRALGGAGDFVDVQLPLINTSISDLVDLAEEFSHRLGSLDRDERARPVRFPGEPALRRPGATLGRGRARGVAVHGGRRPGQCRVDAHADARALTSSQHGSAWKTRNLN